MILLFSVFDKQVGAFMPLFPARAKGEALRMVTDAVADPNGQFAKHLTDYFLFEVGRWDDAAGKLLVSDDHPLKVIDLIELRSE